MIDFGVAKARGPNPLPPRRRLYTGFGAIVGTPEYMSPEQATFNQLDIDTRSDVYALVGRAPLRELLDGHDTGGQNIASRRSGAAGGAARGA